jgi:hyperosmotically inducible periplasmic protein
MKNSIRILLGSTLATFFLASTVPAQQARTTDQSAAANSQKKSEAGQAGMEKANSTNSQSDDQSGNTAKNIRDREGTRVTPFDQSNTKSDIEITQSIRKGIIARKELSVNAHNVKIITVDGRVTLRGQVNGPEEKRIVGDIAKECAPSANIDNQLDAK